ncbi:hypothetical protein [Vagococcus fluvialis]|uniref:hypothetical protein n=1 Tax=Vagococcus fluvialis TaxID=2738 RepID=UPI001A8ED650|nr:hypothetical protein [Vagococcus fluvialis]MBO0485936.1 hypothetical protein [Vagococcus fluvialis]
MQEIKWTLDFLNSVNGGLMLLFGMGINQGYQKLKKWRKKDILTLDEQVSQIDILVSNLVESNLALAHDKLYEKCTQYINRGYITIGELDNLEYIFTSYKKLGGNGTGEHLYLEAKKLPLKGGD